MSSCVPDSARLVIDRRYLIEENVDDVREEIIDLLERVKQERKTFEYDIKELWQVSPTMANKEAPVVQAVHKAISSVLKCEPTYVVSPGTYDQKHIDRIGKLKDCIAYGPGILDLAHQPDEYISIQDMIDSAKVMANTLVTLLKPE